MKLKYTFENVDMGDEIVSVPVGEAANVVRGVLKMNNSGKVIIDLLKEDTTEEKILNHLMSKYDNNKDDLLANIQEIIDILKKADLITE